MHVKIVTTYGRNANPEMVELQAAVFRHFNIPHEQVLTELPPAESIEAYVNLHLADIYLVCDLDAIPLNKEVVEHCIKLAEEGYIVGAAQNANHIKGSKDYASSAFFCFNREVWRQAGRPTFKATKRGDVASELTYTMPKKYLFYPEHVQHPEWETWHLSNGNKFGIGTTYEGGIYHMFNSRYHKHDHLFIEKCKEVLSC